MNLNVPVGAVIMAICVVFGVLISPAVQPYLNYAGARDDQSRSERKWAVSNADDGGHLGVSTARSASVGKVHPLFARQDLKAAQVELAKCAKRMSPLRARFREANAIITAQDAWSTLSTEAVCAHYRSVTVKKALWNCSDGYRRKNGTTSLPKEVRCLPDGSPPQWTVPRGLISVYASPNRIGDPLFEKTIASVLDTHPTWPIYIIVPKKPRRTDVGRYPDKSPSWMLKYFYTEDDNGMLVVPRIRVVRPDEDQGPTSKLLFVVSVLDTELQPEDMIVTVNDDEVYHPDMVRVAIESAMENPNAIISHGGTISSGPAKEHAVQESLRGEAWRTPGFGNHLRGFAGVLYRRKFIRDDWFNPDKVWGGCALDDDTWFSLMAYFSGCPIFIPGVAAFDGTDSNSMRARPMPLDQRQSLVCEEAAMEMHKRGVAFKKVTSHVDCKDLDRMVVERELGRGAMRIAFVVAVPNGERYAAKRSLNSKAEGSLFYEASIFEGLFEQFGDAVLPFYGTCEGIAKHQESNGSGRWEEADLTNLTVGKTVFTALGKPLVEYSKYLESNPKRYALTDPADLEGLRCLARAYSTAKIGRFSFGGDNKYTKQYVRGPNPGKIWHIDLGTIGRSNDSFVKTGDGGKTSVLDHNCHYLFHWFANLQPSDPLVNCTASFSASSVCSSWSCTCQGFSNTFGTKRWHWAKALELPVAKKWWHVHHCDTQPNIIVVPQRN